MDFLNPVFLWSLIGVVVPFTIHFWGRKKNKNLPFSYIKFLKLSRIKTFRFKQIEEFLILLLRTLITTLLLLSLANPISKSSFLVKGRKYAVFLIDNSMSLSANRGKPWIEMKKVIKSVLTNMEKNTFVSLIFTDGSYFPFSMDLKSIERLINGKGTSYCKGNLLRGIEKGKEILARKEGRKILFIFSDMQETLWKEIENKEINFGKIDVYLVRVGNSVKDNLAIKYVRKKRGGKYTCGIVNFGERELTGNLVISETGKTLKMFSILPEKEKVLNFNLPEREKSIFKIEISDVLLPDNFFYFNERRKKIEKVLIITKNLSASRFIKNALLSLSSLQKIEIEEISPLKTSDVFLSEFGFIFIVDVGRLRKDFINSIHSYVENGGNILFFAGDRVNPVNFNEDWMLREKNIFLMPAELKEKIFFRNPEKVVWVDEKSDIFSDFGTDVYQFFRNVNFWKVFSVKNKGGNILMETQGGYSLILQKHLEKGNVILFAFLPEGTWTNFHLRVFFPVMIGKTMEVLKEVSGFVSFITGKKVTMKFPEKYEMVEIISPDGKVERVKQKDNEIEFTPEIPGFWKLRFYKTNKRIGKVISVNVEWEEGNLDEINIEKIKSSLKGKIYFVEGKPEEIEEIFTTNDLTELFILIAFLLFAGDILIMRKHRKNGKYKF